MSGAKDGGTGESPDQLQAIFARAAKIAEAMPEPLRAAAFERAMNHLLPSSGVSGAVPTPGGAGGGTAPPPRARAAKGSARGTTGGGGKPATNGTGGGASTADAAAVVAHLTAQLDRTAHADGIVGRKTLDRSLHLLRAAQGHGVNVMTTREIADVLTEKFREPTTPDAVRVALDRAPKYTDRRMRDGTVVYALMGPGERYLDAQPNEADAPPARPRSRGRRRGAVRAGAAGGVDTDGAAAKPAKSGATARGERAAGRAKPDGAEPPAEGRSTTRKAAKAAKPSGRLGPKAMLEMLIGEGVFDARQTIGSLLAHIAEKRGHTYSATDLSPTLTRLLREKKLDRDRNAEGQYEYRADFGRSRSPISEEADHPFRSKPISHFAEADHCRPVVIA